MLKFKKQQLIIPISIISVVVVLGLFLNMNYHQNKTKTQTFKRDYKKDLLKFVRSIEFKGYLGGIKYFNGKLYLNDFYNRQIVEMDTLGNILNQYSEKVDQKSPYMTISWNIDEKGIYLADGKRHLITHLGFDGSIYYQFEPNQKIHRAGKLKDDKFLIKTYDPKNPGKLTLMMVAAKNKSKKAVDYPLPAVEETGLKLDGFFIKNEKDQTFFICYMTGIFFSIDDDGKFLYLAETIDKSPHPEVLVQGPARRYNPLFSAVNRSASADEKFLYILSNVESPNDFPSDSSVIDAYRVEDGKYMWSFRIPNKSKNIKRITVSPDGFYFRMDDETLNFYRINKTDQLQ